MEKKVKDAIKQCYDDYQEAVNVNEMPDSPDLLNHWAFKDGAEWIIKEMRLNNDIDEETFLKYIRIVL